MSVSGFVQVNAVAAVVAVPQPAGRPQPSAGIFIGFAILLILGWVGVKLVQIWWFPDYRCRRCDGVGRFYGSNRKSSRACRRCGGMGRRIRIGRRIFNYIAKVRRAW